LQNSCLAEIFHKLTYFNKGYSFGGVLYWFLATKTDSPFFFEKKNLY